MTDLTFDAVLEAYSRVSEVLPETPPLPTIFGCLFPHKKLQDPKIRLFVDHVAKQGKARFAVAGDI